MVRSTRVARMAAAAGLPITVHISGGNTGFAEMANFCSFTPNIGRFQELKRGVEETGRLFDPPAQVRSGLLTVPQAPGMGMVHVDELLKTARKNHVKRLQAIDCSYEEGLHARKLSYAQNIAHLPSASAAPLNDTFACSSDAIFRIQSVA